MFADTLKTLRIQSNLTQKDLAEAFNVAQGTIAMWETGKRTPDLEMIKRIAAYFKVSTDYLMGETKYKNIQEYKDYNWGIGDPFFEAPFDFCALLKDIRESQNIPIAEISDVLGCTEDQYEECEEGVLPITYDQAEKLCDYLGTNVSQVLFDNQLYDDEVPEEYHDDVRAWEKIKSELEEDARAESAKMMQETLNPDIRMIARAGKKMTPEQAENLRKYAQFMFPEAFKDD